MNVFFYASNFKKILKWNRIITFEVDKEKSRVIIKKQSQQKLFYTKSVIIPNVKGRIKEYRKVK